VKLDSSIMIITVGYDDTAVQNRQMDTIEVFFEVHG
jgi:hypothetical protein